MLDHTFMLFLPFVAGIVGGLFLFGSLLQVYVVLESRSEGLLNDLSMWILTAVGVVIGVCLIVYSVTGFADHAALHQRTAPPVSKFSGELVDPDFTSPDVEQFTEEQKIRDSQAKTLRTLPVDGVLRYCISLNDGTAAGSCNMDKVAPPA